MIFILTILLFIEYATMIFRNGRLLLNLGPTILGKGGYLDGKEVEILDRFRFGKRGGEERRKRGREEEEGGSHKRAKIE